MGGPGFDLYLVVSGGEPALARALEVIAAAPRGRLAVQARWKDEDDGLVVPRIERLVRAAEPVRVPVLVSGRADLARATGAAGVHLPEAAPEVAAARAALPRGALVGASSHDAHGLARRRDADFVVLGPVGEVPAKGPPLDDAHFAALVAGAAPPVFALGGVRAPADVARVRRAGAHGIAVQRAILESARPTEALGSLLAALDATRR